MKIRIFGIITFFLFTVNCFANDFGKLESYIPKSGVVKVDVMILGAPLDIQEIGSRMQLEIQSKPEWFKSYISDAVPGEPLAYHSNFGISEDEYKHFLNGVNSKMSLVKKAEANISVTYNDQGSVIISGLPAKKPHDKIVYDVKLDTINVGLNSLNKFSEINQDNKDSATGRWNGKQWMYQNLVSKGDFTSIKFAIGKMLDLKKNIIYYDVNMAIDGSPEKLGYILLFNPI